MKSFSRPQAAIVILVSLLLLSIYGWRNYSSNREYAQSPQLVPMSIIVQVSGEVRLPGIYSFDQPVTVSQTVARAGGLLPHLRTEPKAGWTKLQVDHARRVHILSDTNGAARLRLRWMAVPSRIVLGVPLDVNQATEAELASVPGITQPMAERIVTQRNRLGGFSKFEDLGLVKGIGPVTLKRLQEYLMVGTKE